MADLKGSKTHANLKDAFAGESQANRRYLYFAKIADVEGHPDLAGLFRETLSHGIVIAAQSEGVRSEDGGLAMRLAYESMKLTPLMSSTRRVVPSPVAASTPRLKAAEARRSGFSTSRSHGRSTAIDLTRSVEPSVEPPSTISNSNRFSGYSCASNDKTQRSMASASLSSETISGSNPMRSPMTRTRTPSR